MDLRTFLKPRRPLQAPLPAVGQAAPPLPGVPDAEGRPRIIAFLRHVGCPFAEATMKELMEAKPRHPEFQFVAVSHGTLQATNHWCQVLKVGEQVPVVIDPQGEIYGAWGLGLTSLRHFVGTNSLKAVSKLARRGIRNRHPSGSRWQSAGTYGVDARGVLRWCHLPRHAGDMPDLAAAVAAMGEKAVGEAVPVE